MPLKYLCNFLRSIEMPLIHCKIELKLKWTKNGVLSAAAADNTNANHNNIIFTIKKKPNKVICFCCNFISMRQPKTIKSS